MKKLAVILAAIVLFPASARADMVFSAVNLEGWGADGGGDGSATTPSLIASVNFNLPAITSLDGVFGQFAHDFGSDITIELIAPDLSSYLIVEGDGPTGNPHQGGGDGDELGNDGVGFGLVNVVDYWIVPNGTTGTNWLGISPLLPSGTYDQRLVGSESWANGPFAAGTWTFNLYDSWDTLDAGAVGTIGLQFSTAIPEPGTFSLLALGLAGTAIRRRRKARA